ncbi:undecaprenyl-diphosphate phosphatase [Massilia arenae]|uniref:Undecaprenyl-diphosphatase n=1 Tax=Massilia arenae TaxID=2603288 RepID=A0A5C7G2P7_9BURK|nr:undecaprenyl-diphosphate phosphatase [Massilia arenae]TXF98704.1 undecaprenyl-diphosphate phosphatase [Massilia arenae]
MDIALAIKAIIMGLVEGFTEFLPISSTGHLILAGELLNFTGVRETVFKIVIQLGAVLAVVWEYRERVMRLFAGLGSDPLQQRFARNVAIAFMPAAVAGVLFSATITELLFHPVPVAIALVVGGVIILWVEHRQRQRATPPRVETVDQMTALDALKVGFAQSFALIPGTSRSGSTIIGGMLFGLSRKAATEFSFFLAMPTMLGATVYSVVKEREALSMADVPMFGLGFVSAFIAAFLCVRWLLRYISTHDFTIFAWYRIVFGILVLVTAHFGLVNWSE